MIDEKIEKGGYIMTKPFGACLVIRRYRVLKPREGLWYQVQAHPKNPNKVNIPETLCTRRATEKEFKRI